MGGNSALVNKLILGDNLEILKTMEAGSVGLIYLDSETLRVSATATTRSSRTLVRGETRGRSARTKVRASRTDAGVF
jgi:hypothetical protein